MRFLLLATVLLAACSQVPLSIAIQDSQTDVVAINTSSIVFQKANQAQTPPTAVKSIQLEGTANYKTENVTMEFFASDGPPCSNQIGGLYTCAPSANTESIGETSFAGGASQGFKWFGSKLTDGINKGTLYLGIRLKSGLLTSGTIQFTNMVAKVAVF